MSGHLLLLKQVYIIRHYIYVHRRKSLSWFFLCVCKYLSLSDIRDWFQGMYRASLVLLFCVLQENAHAAGFMKLITV